MDFYTHLHASDKLHAAREEPVKQFSPSQNCFTPTIPTSKIVAFEPFDIKQINFSTALGNDQFYYKFLWKYNSLQLCVICVTILFGVGSFEWKTRIKKLIYLP